MQQALLAVFGGIVLLFLLLGAAIDMAARIEYAQETFPWLKRQVENRKWRTVVLLATCLFYGGTLYELLNQPGNTLHVRFPPPAAPNVVVQKRVIKTTGSGRLDRDMNDQQSDRLYHQLKSLIQK